MQRDEPSNQRRIYHGGILILVAVLALIGLAGCGSGDDDDVDDEAADSVPPTMTGSANVAEPSEPDDVIQTAETTSPATAATESNPTGTLATSEPEGAATGAPSAATLGAPTPTVASPDGTPPGDNVIELTEGFTLVEFNNEYQDALEDANVNFEAIGPARQENDYDVELPIVGGTINLEGPSGIINCDGGLRFVMDDAVIDFTDIVVDLDSRAVTAMVNGEQMTILTLDLSAVSREDDPDPNLTVGFDDVIGIFTQPAADAINSALGVDVFQTDTKVDIDFRLAGQEMRSPD